MLLRVVERGVIALGGISLGVSLIEMPRIPCRLTLLALVLGRLVGQRLLGSEGWWGP